MIYGILGMWYAREVAYWVCGMLVICDIGDVGYWRYGCLGCGMWDVLDVECPGCEMPGMCDVGCLSECGILIYKMPER